MVSFSAIGFAPSSLFLGILHRCLLRSYRIQYSFASGRADLDQDAQLIHWADLNLLPMRNFKI